MWRDKMRRLEAHGDELKVAPSSRSTHCGFKYFGIWEADSDIADVSKSYEELSKVKDCARRREVDSAAKELVVGAGGGYRGRARA
jgi:hypothetical protein